MGAAAQAHLHEVANPGGGGKKRPAVHAAPPAEASPPAPAPEKRSHKKKKPDHPPPPPAIAAPAAEAAASAAAARYEADGEEGAEGAPLSEDDVACTKCGRTTDAFQMLLCDGEGGTCPAAYHTYCLTPPLLSLPKGDWFCPPCELKRQAGSGMSMRQQMRYLADLAEAPEPPAPPVAAPTAAAATAPAMADAAATAGAGARAAADDDAVEDEEDLPLAGR